MRFASAVLLPLTLMATLTIGRAYGQEVASSVSPQQLRIDFLTRPVGLDSKNPHFSWTLKPANPAARNLSQSAYRILLATSLSQCSGLLHHLACTWL